MKIIFSAHALHRMGERGITEEEIHLTFTTPDKADTKDDTLIAMKVRSNGHLLIVIYRKNIDTHYIITVIDTSKVHKYL